MNGSNRPLMFCVKCETKRIPEGGVYMNPRRWICSKCWLEGSRTK
jgi:hypothetical protein